VSGATVHGYRAPSFSIGPSNRGRSSASRRAGYRYSSSIYPIRHDHYGAPDAPRFAHEVRPGCSRCRSRRCALRRNWPAGGGGYFRLLPYALRRWSIARVNRVDRSPRSSTSTRGSSIPRSRASPRARKTRFRHYLNLRPDRAAPAPAAPRLPLGPRRPRVPARSALMAPDGSPARRAHGARARRGRGRRCARGTPSSTRIRTPRSSTVGWRGLIERVSGIAAITSCRARRPLIGVLPLAEVRSRLFGHALVSLPFAVYGGPLADDAATARALDRPPRTSRGDCASGTWSCATASPAATSGRSRTSMSRSASEILPDVEANLLAIPRKQRAMVRKGIKNGLSASTDATPDRFFALYADNMHRHGTPAFGPAYFRALADVFGERCEFLVVADAAGKPVSGVCSFYFRDEVLPYYAGDVTAARDLAANDFKYWELMRRACERGLRIFDYGRSKKGTGSFDFKKNWGFVPTPLAYEYALVKRTAIPQNNPLNPKYRAMIATWRRLPRRSSACSVRCSCRAWGERGRRPLPRPPAAVPAQQGRQAALVPPARGACRASPRAPRDVHRRSRRRGAPARGAGAVRDRPRRARSPRVPACARPPSRWRAACRSASRTTAATDGGVGAPHRARAGDHQCGGVLGGDGSVRHAPSHGARARRFRRRRFGQVGAVRALAPAGRRARCTGARRPRCSSSRMRSRPGGALVLRHRAGVRALSPARADRGRARRDGRERRGTPRISIRDARTRRRSPTTRSPS
jgi:FemAB-related protein (PEP-CTERM system-associated)